jgi:RNA polymerase sigma-70 factor, ECF subfamily
MTVVAAETHRATLRLVEAARAGDDAAFRELVEQHRRAIHVHCYRMLGSVHEAEDVAQETFFRAWRFLDAYAARASFSAWLYGIATHACLDELRRPRPRRLPPDLFPPDDPKAEPASPRAEIAWLEPYPDALLDPAERAASRETLRLAFVAAIQNLPARQRAALLLRDVLGWSAQEVADLLGTSVASVNSALQRARVVVPAERPPEPVEEELAARYLAAWEAADVPALAKLLRDDVEMAMPPTPSWYRGRDAVAAFLAATLERFPGIRLVPTSANTQPAFTVLVGEETLALKVLSCERDGIRALAGFS